MDYKLDLDYKLGLHQALNETSEVWDFEKEELDPEKLEFDMCNFMLNHNGIGLAANQLNIKKRVFAIGAKTVPGFPEPFCVFNPVIIEASEEQVLDKEGCLSFPGLWLHLQRPKMIIAQYQTSKGETKEAKIEGYLAKCFQHELDHLNGICFVDKVSRLKLQLAMKKLKKRQKLNDRT
jgi:peptide deformylase|tara:strand:- start:1799 stop:2332 length:534 start_codon:yes stop_codon:yes gene_type:complete